VKPSLSVLILAVTGVLILAGAGAIGYAIGHRDNAPVEAIHTGVAAETRYSGTATAGGVSYVLPLNVPWIDAVGTLHDGPGPPPCLRKGNARHLVFATVSYSVADAAQGIVIWVRC
jgi:hypothetical protein